MQREMPFLGECKRGQMVNSALIQQCRHRLDAIRLCVQLSGLSNEYIADYLGIDKGHFSRIMQGKAWFPDTKSIDLITLCGNYAPLQYEAWATGFELFKDAKAQRLQELKAEIAALEAAA
jgi:transcriptional regulator with XRE-family HTH domain